MQHTICLLAILSVGAAAASCYTRVCKQRYNGNARDSFFAPGTFGADIHPNPSQPVRGNGAFREYVNSKLGCTGDWCVADKYQCKGRGNKNCYHVEHIIDQHGKDPRVPAGCPRSCRGVPGNMVMASGQWNSALGGLAQSNYEAAQAEKASIYGDRAITGALRSIAACCGARNAHLLEFRALAVVSNDTDYDASCDDTSDCNCDSGAECGCECDFEDPFLLQAILAFVFTDLAMSILTFVTLLGISCCACYICHKARTAPGRYASLVGMQPLSEPAAV